ncbi:MAG: hypothetical protein AAF823_10445 [Planctomycetota bacterium]
MPTQTPTLESDTQHVSPDTEPPTQDTPSEAQATTEPNPEPAERLVPVAEAIRYRRRAQSAEQQLSDTAQQLKQLEHDLTAARQTITDLERREAITDRLREAGAVDLDVARLLTEVAVAGMPDADVRLAVDELRRDKPYLFQPAPAPRRAMGARLPEPDPAADAAERAEQTGDRRDLMTYLRLRRRA